MGGVCCCLPISSPTIPSTSLPMVDPDLFIKTYRWTVVETGSNNNNIHRQISINILAEELTVFSERLINMNFRRIILQNHLLLQQELKQILYLAQQYQTWALNKLQLLNGEFKKVVLSQIYLNIHIQCTKPLLTASALFVDTLLDKITLDINQIICELGNVVSENKQWTNALLYEVIIRELAEKFRDLVQFIHCTYDNLDLITLH